MILKYSNPVIFPQHYSSGYSYKTIINYNENYFNYLKGDENVAAEDEEDFENQNLNYDSEQNNEDRLNSPGLDDGEFEEIEY